MPANSCRLCHQPLFPEPLLVQENMPAAAQGFPSRESLSQDKGVTLALYQCTGCGVIQLTSPPVPYWRDVIRSAGISREMRDFRLEQFREWIEKEGLLGAKVVEIGCGRGEYLSLLAELGVNAFGVEHNQDSVAACRERGLQVQQGFVADERTIVPEGPFDGFVILNFLEHIPSAHLTLRGIAANLRDRAVGIVEVPAFEAILQAGLFAEFIPDHCYYFTRQTLTCLLEMNGFEVIECRLSWHGYVLSAKVRKRRRLDLSPLHNTENKVKNSFDSFLNRFPTGAVAVWGAGHQALALICLMGIESRIAAVIDSATFKQGRYTPVSHLPIVAPEWLDEGKVEAIIVLAASYADEVAGLIQRRYGNRFVTAVLGREGLTVLGGGDGGER